LVLNGVPEVLVVQAELASLSRVGEWAQTHATRMELPPTTAYAIQLSCEEMLSNILRHGFAGQPDQAACRKDVRFTLERRGRSVFLTIEDFGADFDPLTVAPPPVAATIEEAVVGGQGLHLMRHFAQGMRHERRDGMNRLTVRFDTA
jgi:serine/threonine-protein kinase RsbW